MTNPVNPDLPKTLLEVFEQLRAHLQIGLCEQGLELTPPDVCLLELIGSDAGLSLQDVGRQMSRDKALITRKIREMEARGLVRRERNPHDARSFRLFLTEAGEQVDRQARNIQARSHRSLFGGLDSDEQATLARLLRQCLERQATVDS
ncbi:Multidrug resistance operon repressor [compost metagenome]|uniref:MarR family transcriptional regulator, repressor of the mexAB-oprM multidrug resistance operon n=1 Tax=Pseudomonas jinjuensis TaxID=198616 RepID=A0A1H0ILM5_9PSED|nr:MarR family transcriptional regulator [Pseudomonas jinjuensis]SDO32379.1 MarR family transcriptional regulator, repressor of the mexAB-oprM multidrug resistance operon [Pseudomonas jinjuensis]